MKLPRRFLKNIARDLTLANLDQLNYVGAVALAAGPIADPRVEAYVRYFKAEQEQDTAAKDRVLGHCEETSALEPVTLLLRGRRLLEKRTLTSSDVSTWLAESEPRCPAELRGYLRFLAGIGGLQAGDHALSARHLGASAREYHRAGKRSRELQCFLQDPSMSMAEIRYLRSHAREASDLKSYHVAGLALAMSAQRLGDGESARRYASESVGVFRDRFLDPRRERISQGVLDAAHPLDHAFTPLEMRVLKRLERGACSKRELVTEIYGRGSRYACESALDTRFRALLSRLNRKMHGAIVRCDDGYALRRD